NHGTTSGKILFKKTNTEILDELKNIQLFVSQKDIELAKFLEIANPETVFIIRKEQYQNLAEKEEPEQSTLLPELAKSKLGESFSRKLALTISETGTLNYSNFKIKQLAKSKQSMELPIPQEELLMLKESNMIKNKEALQESSKSKIKTNCKQISMLDKENLQKNEHKKLEPVFETIQEMVDNRNKNLQKDISDRFKHEPMKEQDRETSKARSKTIKISKENPYMNNSLASIILKEKTQELDIDEIKNLLLNITSRLDSIKRIVFGSVDKPVSSSNRAPGVNKNGKRLLQKELTLKIGCHNINELKTNQQKFEALGQWLNDEAFDIFAVTKTNLDRKEGFFVGKKVENFKFFWSNTSIDKRKDLG
ncbi:1127_t:CDS:2, partial [Gigaspora margarita]